MTQMINPERVSVPAIAMGQIGLRGRRQADIHENQMRSNFEQFR